MKILILATSAKNSGYCVAGIDIQSSKLVRLVSDDEISDYALSKEDITYYNGNICRPLDVVDIKNLTYAPSEKQRENYRIDNRYKFNFMYHVDKDLYPIFSRHNIFERNKWSFMGSDKHFLDKNEYKRYGKSIAIYYADSIRIYQKQYENNKPKSKATININGKFYNNISVTDFDYFYMDDTTISNTILVCSLPNMPYKDLYYKFIAKIIKTSESYESNS